MCGVHTVPLFLVVMHGRALTQSCASLDMLLLPAFNFINFFTLCRWRAESVVLM